MSELTREQLLSRLEERRRQERQAFANFNAAHGAVVELESLIAMLDAGEGQEKE